MRGIIALLVVGVSSWFTQGMAEGTSNTAKYSAFDLTGSQFKLAKNMALNDDVNYRIEQEGKPLPCRVTADDRSLTIERKSGNVACPLFFHPQPAAVAVVAYDKSGNAPGIVIQEAKFDSGEVDGGAVLRKGELHVIAGAVAGRGLEVAVHTDNEGWLLYSASSSSQDHHWHMTVGQSPIGDRVYARTLGVNPSEAAKIFAVPLLLDKLDRGQEFCSSTSHWKRVFVDNNEGIEHEVNYRICIDELAHGVLSLTENKRHYAKPFEWGMMRVRHRKEYAAVLVGTGTRPSILQPGLANAPGAAEGEGLTNGQSAAVETISGDYRISTFFIPPHAPGAFHLDVKLQDSEGKQKSTPASVDLIVDQAYRGAIRLGISKSLFADDRRYYGLKRHSELPSEIHEARGEPTELAVGYALFFDRRPGRTYAISASGLRGRVLSTLGVYAGFGAVSYAADKFDFLRSFHLGLDIEVSRLVSFALTWNIRRQARLAEGFEVGGPTPDGDIPTRSSYASALGLMLNLSFDFMKSAASGVASK